MRLIAVLLAALCAGCNGATDCSPVAKLVFYAPEHKDEIKVVRGSAAGAARETRSDQLCAGDRVHVPQGLQVGIKYLQLGDSLVKLEGPGEYPVLDNVRAGSTLHNALKSADVFHWFQEAGKSHIEAAISRSLGMTSPLDGRDAPDAPLHVKSSLPRLFFFWQGGTGPWQVELAGPGGEILARVQVQETKIDLPCPAPDVRGDARLIVRSADDRRLQRSIRVEAVSGPARAPDVPDWGGIVTMLADNQRNWRLQVWSELQAAPASGMKAAVMSRLEKNGAR